MHLRSQSDLSELQILANAICQVEVELNHARGAVPEIRRELDFLRDEGAVERIAQVKLATGHRAISLEALIPRLQIVLQEIRELAGDKALERAAAPIVFER